MATIKIDSFKGLVPRMHASALPDGYASVAENLRLKNGKIVPLKVPLQTSGITCILENGLSAITSAKTIYPWKKRNSSNQVETVFLAWPGIVDVARGNLADDEYDRIFVSGKTGIPHATSGANEPAVYLCNRSTGVVTRRTLVKEALPAPQVKRTDTEELSDDNKRYTYFFQTWVDKYGYESPVSDKSLSWNDTTSSYVESDFEYNDGDAVTIAAVTKPTGAVLRRVYKVVTGTSTEAIQFIAEFDGVGAWDAHEITVKDEDAGETITVVTAPPSDLSNICIVPGSYYVGFSPSSPKTVMFSEIDMPYSWPSDYWYDVRDNIVGLAVTSNSVFVMTDGYPYVISGTAPETMSPAMLANPAACVSKQSICVYKNSVYYAGNCGICCIYNDANEGTTVANITDKFFTKEQWDELNPSSCKMSQFDGALHCFFEKTVDGTTTHYGYIIDLTERDCMITTHDEIASCVCVDDKSDTLYYVKEAT